MKKRNNHCYYNTTTSHLSAYTFIPNTLAKHSAIMGSGHDDYDE
jgi:hypothetical protein